MNSNKPALLLPKLKETQIQKDGTALEHTLYSYI